MKRECPKWADKIGSEVRLLTNKTEREPQSITALLKRIDENEVAMQRENECSMGIEVDPKRNQ